MKVTNYPSNFRFIVLFEINGMLKTMRKKLPEPKPGQLCILTNRKIVFIWRARC